MKKQTHLSKMKILLFLFFAPAILLAQETITGRVVVESTGEGAPFVNIIENGTDNGTASDIDGNFSITVSSLPARLKVFALGFGTKMVDVATAGAITVQISESSESLEEVVVTGLATSVKRSNAANAVASLSAEELVGTTPPPTIDGALYGKFAGAVVSANSGAPGGGLSIKLRGATSITGNTQPLYIIDGVYVDNSSIPSGLNAVSAATAGGAGDNPRNSQDNPTNRIADINPDDIENIEILKGASAAAIYGSRAAAGVVIITTKRGKAGETKYRVSQSTGWTQVINLLGTRNFTEERVFNQFFTPNPDPVTEQQSRDAANAQVALFREARNLGRLVDYEEELFGERGFITNTNFSVSGGGEKTRFFAGVTHNNENGIVKNTGYEKTSLRLNVDHRMNDRVKLSVSSNYINSSSDRGFFNNDNTGTTIGVGLTATYPWFNLFPDADGNYPDYALGSSNVLQTRDLVTNNEKVSRFIMGGSANIDLYQSEKSNLELIVRGGVDAYALNSLALFPKELQFQKPANNGVNGVSIQGQTTNLNYNLAGFLVHTYNTDNQLSFRTQAGLTREFFDRNSYTTTSSSLVASETNVDQAQNTGINQFRLKQQDAGFFVQEEINFQDKIIGTIGLRGDKSSNNGDANQLYYYPKGSLASNLHKFDFWGDSGVWNQLKVRAAYGEAGNFAPFGALFTSYNAFTTDGLLGISLINIKGDKSIEPERQKELEMGLDLGFLNNRISGSFTYYIKTVDDLILQAAIEPSSGFTSRFVNGGSLRNNGVEIAINAVPVATEDFEWSTSVNFFKNTSEVTELNVPAFNIGAFGATLGTFRIEEGQSATQIVGITPNGVQKLGDAEPDFQVGFNNTIRFKTLELNFLWQWKKGGDNINLTALLTDLNGTSHDYDEIDLDPSGQLGNGAYRASQLGTSAEVFVEDASYLRLRELGLYYSLPKKFVDSFAKGYVDNVKFGFSGTNLVNIFDYNSYDPEVSNFGSNGIFTGVEVTPFPSSKRFLFNVAVDF